LGASCEHHRSHQVDSFGVIEAVFSDQRAPSPVPDRVSDRRGDAGALPASISAAPHQRGMHCLRARLVPVS